MPLSKSELLNSPAKANIGGSLALSGVAATSVRGGWLQHANGPLFLLAHELGVDERVSVLRKYTQKKDRTKANHASLTWRSSTWVASTKFTIAAAQSIFTWGWSQQDSNLLAAPKQAAARSLVTARGLVAVERFLSAAEQIASPLSSPERAEDARHLQFVFHVHGKGA